MRVLVVGPAQKAEIERLKAYAEMPEHLYVAAPFSAERHGKKPPGDNPNHVLFLPIGFRCVYSITELPMIDDDTETTETLRHLTISVQATDRLPHPAAVEEIAQAFGFSPSCMIAPHAVHNCIVVAEPYRRPG